MAYIIGLTGGIGSGKTQVTNILAQQGVPIVDADVVARQLVGPETPALLAIVEHFGLSVLTDTGVLDRKALRHIIFNNNAEKTWLESLLHPMVQQQCGTLLNAINDDYGVLVSPLLLESDHRQLVNIVVVVDATPQQQVGRAQQRDNVPDTNIQAIMKAQMPRKKRLQQAHYIIDNTKDIEHLRQQVQQLMQYVERQISQQVKQDTSQG